MFKATLNLRSSGTPTELGSLLEMGTTIRYRKIQIQIQKYTNTNTNTNGHNYQVQENGSLFFSAVEKQDEAEYRCKVSQIIMMLMMMAVMMMMMMTSMMTMLMTTMMTMMMISNGDYEGQEHVRGGSVPCCPAQS